jgi:flagellar motor switch protein FliM
VTSEGERALDPAAAEQADADTPRVFGRRRSLNAASIEERDFRGAPRPGPSERKEIESLARRVALALERGIGNYLRQPVRAETVAPEVLEYQEAVRSFAEKDWVVPLLADGGDRAVLRLDDSFTNMMLTRVLGGGPLAKAPDAPPVEDEEFFEYESALTIETGPISRSALKPLVRSILREWNALLREGRAPLALDAGRETMPAARQLRNNDAVIAFDHEIWFGQEHGRVQLLLQCAALNEILAAVADVPALTPPVDPARSRSVEHVVRALDVELRVVLGVASIELKDYMKLQVGDVMVLGRKFGQPLDVHAGDTMEFKGQPGRSGGKIAVRITERLSREATS